MGEVAKWINICRSNPIQILNLREFFVGFYVCSSNDTFEKKYKKSDVGTGAPQQRQEVY